MTAERDSSMQNQAYQFIRKKIERCEYAPNDMLSESLLREELGFSRTPVREALRQLELEGLVSIIPNRGAFVTGISNKDIKDIYLIRSLLEGLCARWAAENISEEKLTEGTAGMVRNSGALSVRIKWNRGVNMKGIRY